MDAGPEVKARNHGGTDLARPRCWQKRRAEASSGSYGGWHDEGSRHRLPKEHLLGDGGHLRRRQ